MDNMLSDLNVGAPDVISPSAQTDDCRFYTAAVDAHTHADVRLRRLTQVTDSTT